MRSVLTDLIAALARSSRWVSLIVATTNGIMAYTAFVEFFSGPSLSASWAKVLAAAAAIACGGSLHLIYTGLLSGMPAIDRLWRARFVPEIAILGVFILAFSTYANITVTAGDDALDLHGARQIDGMLGASGQLQTAAMSVAQLAPDLAAKADALREKAECEAASGCLSGAPGTGSLTDALNSASTKVATAGMALTDVSLAIAALMPQLEEAFGRGDNIAIRSLIADVRASVPLDMLLSLATDLRADLGIAPDGRSAAIRARQAEAIAHLQKNLGTIAQGLDRAAARLRSDLDSITLPDRETITKAKAILMYADQLGPQIALGVALDWVLIVIAFFMAKLRDATPAEEDDVSDISLAQARRNHRELMRLIRDVSDKPASPEVEKEAEPEPPSDPEPEVVPEADTPPWDDEDNVMPQPRIVVPFREPAE